MNKYINMIRNITRTAVNFYVSNEHRYSKKKKLELVLISLKKGYQLKNSIYYFK